MICRSLQFLVKILQGVCQILLFQLHLTDNNDGMFKTIHDKSDQTRVAAIIELAINAVFKGMVASAVRSAPH